MSKYTDLITSEHEDKPKFLAVVDAVTSYYSDLIEFYSTLPSKFDIDVATGVQLDVLGEWVGRSRFVKIPLTGVYFTWDDTALVGWNAGVWKGVFDPDTGLTRLPDDAYRKLLKAKIAANNWDGTADQASAIFSSLFSSNSFVILQDNYNMTFGVLLGGSELSAVDKALITGGYLPLKPQGVHLSWISTAHSATAPVFSWGSQDANGTYLGGWGTAEWSSELTIQ